MIVPTLCVGMQPGTLRVPFQCWNAERGNNPLQTPVFGDFKESFPVTVAVLVAASAAVFN